MTPNLKDRIAVVTGASRGIGYFTALELARAGAHVVACARTLGGLEELDDAIKAFGGSATLVPFDLADMTLILNSTGAEREALRSQSTANPLGSNCRQFSCVLLQPKVMHQFISVNRWMNCAYSPDSLGRDRSDLIAVFEQLVDDTVHQCLK